ncbi:hypothetical protein GOP47_0024952 [Adiantum capillus-veneris]|uniref:F-box domain-containing protein n=1 Tax=Adiantum capillus-veneris TaxID=13818 RepID=A0A9D4Z4S7_ADICA|nr:hypothetical protein GOP47_0024952 [Adiantum capillus-veneris]
MPTPSLEFLTCLKSQDAHNLQPQRKGGVFPVEGAMEKQSRKPIEPTTQDAGNDDDDDGLPLPAHAHDLILDRLPVRNRRRMWCVCKAWNSFLQSFKSEEIWFVMARPPKYGPRNWRVSSYGHLEWRFRAYSTCSLHKTEEETSELEQKAFFRPPLPNPVLCLTGWPQLLSRGLISAIVRRPDAAESYDFIVFNCLTGSVKVLPPPSLSMQGPNTFYLSMTRNGKDPSCYYILLNTCFLFPTSFEFFESRSACWKEVNNPHLYFKSGKSLRNFVSSHPSSDHLSVVDADFWWLVSSMDDREHCLLAYHGDFFWVGPDHVILGFGVWELQLGGGHLWCLTWLGMLGTPCRWRGLQGSSVASLCIGLASVLSRRPTVIKVPPLVFDMAYCDQIAASGV